MKGCHPEAPPLLRAKEQREPREGSRSGGANNRAFGWLP
jgi:hypothetical protein